MKKLIGLTLGAIMVFGGVTYAHATEGGVDQSACETAAAAKVVRLIDSAIEDSRGDKGERAEGRKDLREAKRIVSSTETTCEPTEGQGEGEK